MNLVWLAQSGQKVRDYFFSALMMVSSPLTRSARKAMWSPGRNALKAIPCMTSPATRKMSTMRGAVWPKCLIGFIVGTCLIVLAIKDWHGNTSRLLLLKLLDAEQKQADSHATDA